MNIASLPFSLESPKSTSWTINQEKSIAKDYPLTNDHDESPQDFVVRTYLQFLWLPESIMPLTVLIPSLERVRAASTSTHHPLHALIEPLLLTTRSLVNKYRKELPQILSDGGGAGEIEEGMMWYAQGYEMTDDDANASDGVWQMKWLDRMEKRETHIQILLYMLKLSLPGDAPPEEPKAAKSKAKLADFRETTPEIPSSEDILEELMDRLMTRQLTSTMFAPLTVDKPVKDVRDPAQEFCEEIVEPLFKSRLPDACALFRSKVFPAPLFSDSSPSSSRASSPELSNPSLPLAAKPGGAAPRAPLGRKPSMLSRSSSQQRYPSPAIAPAASSSSRAGTPLPLETLMDLESSRSLARARSRSLSLSLAQEKERGASAAAQLPRKRVLNREVSMSRVFKTKDKGSKGTTQRVPPKRQPTLEATKPARDEGVTLVEATPVKPKATAQSQAGDRGVAMAAMPPRTSSAQLLNVGSLRQPTLSNVLDGPARCDHPHDEEEWVITSSPDILLLRPGKDEDDGAILAEDTPTKKRKR
ncbi:hypothetical protein HGRIS_004589 [Hohenbuehelia grisea]|uniref:DNA replication regulator Sld3 C-terminal domain-containing protein n=1 Tax=Hohenbuehelia grisea TaxID=104357 RepID=A0ABR3JCH7_9AGAR